MIDDYIHGEITRRHIPGLALAIVHDGQVARLSGYGLANVELEVPVTPLSVFQLQSVTKTMTSSAILLLGEEGKLSIDDPISKYLDGTPPAWKDITLAKLLSHTSGIKDFINEPTTDLRLEMTEQEVFAATVGRPLNFQPGERYAYSNTNYHLLAMVIRKLTGKSYGDFMAERFFKPFEMTQTRIVSLTEIIPRRASGYAWEHGAMHNGMPIAESILAYGGGGVISSATDMAAWAKALDGGHVIKKETLERAWKPTILKDGSPSAYGLGWRIGDINKHRTVSHSGAHSTGFTSAFLYLPEDHLTVIVLDNARQANPMRMAQHIVGLFSPELAVVDPAPIEDKDPKLTARLANILEKIGKGEFESSDFTPELWGVLSGQKDDLIADAEYRGEFKGLTLLSRSEMGQQRTFRYRGEFAHAILRVTFVLLPDDRIAGLSLDEE